MPNLAGLETSVHNKLDAVAYEIAARDAVWASLPLIISEIDTGKVVYCTKHGADVFGYTRDEMLSKQLHDFIQDDVDAPLIRLIGVSKRVCGVKKCGDKFEVHVGLLEVEALGKSVMVILVAEAYDVKESPHPCKE